MNKKTMLHALMLIVFVLVGCSADISIETNADSVVSTAAEIAAVDVPENYHADFSARYESYVIASFRPDDDHSHLYLIQSEEEADGTKLAAALAELVPGSSDSQTRMRIIETRPAVVCGQSTNLILSEGINSDGESYRQATVSFQGKGGPALFIFSEPVSNWDQESVDALLASIYCGSSQ